MGISVNNKKLAESRKFERRTEILARLSEIDSEILRPLRAIVTGTNTAFDDAKILRLEAETEILRAEAR